MGLRDFEAAAKLRKSRGGPRADDASTGGFTDGKTTISLADLIEARFGPPRPPKKRNRSTLLTGLGTTNEGNPRLG